MTKVSFKEVSTDGLEASPVSSALAGLRAHEARYFDNKFKAEYVTTSPEEQAGIVHWIQDILSAERGIEFSSPILEVFAFENDELLWPTLYFENGLAVNVLWTKAEGGKRAVGFKLSVGMSPPTELSEFKWARQRSKLAGDIRGSYFVIKADYPMP